MTDSWEDIPTTVPSKSPEEAHKPKSSALNPKAPSFSFSPSAQEFKPTSVATPPAGFELPTYPPPSGSKIVESQPPASRPAAVPSSIASEPVIPPKPEVAADRQQNDAQVQAEKSGQAERLNALRLSDDQTNGSQSAAQQAAATRNVLPPPSAPDESEDPDEEAREQEAAIDRINEELAKEDAREHMNVVFIGHVDAGKSTTGGQILYLTGNVDERTIQKYEKEAKDKNRESWYMAYIMDTNEEERAKGKTVEVGRAHFTTDKKRYTILDAPGHKNYVPNMIAGATQADVGVLVISARKGEFETGFERGGQTREHAQLAKTLGVTRLIVAINKMDDSSVLETNGKWSKARYDEIVTGLTPFLKSCGYNPKKDIVFLPMSGLLGTNIKDAMPTDVAPWYKGGSLFQVLDDTAPLFRDPLGPFRMSVIDKYKDMGTIAMGKSEAGLVRKGDGLFVMPNKQSVTVSTIYRDDVEVNAASGGENLRLRLAGIEDDELQAGFIICSKNVPVPCVTYFQAQLQLLDLLEHKSIFTAGYKAVLHIHSLVEECEITKLISIMDMKTKTQKKAQFAKSGAIVVVRIEVEKPICIEMFDRVPQLGRFTLRDEGKTIAIGKVIKLPKSLKEDA